MAHFIYGLSTCRDAIASGKASAVFLQDESKSMNLLPVLKEKKISYKVVGKGFLNKLCNNGNHQGIAVELKDDYTTIPLESLLNKIASNTKSILIMLDGIEDPHNLGAILRIADSFGADGIIFKNANQVPLNETVAKVSTGAINYVNCVCVPNLTNTIKKLKQCGYWIYGTDMKASDNYNVVSYAKKSCLVIGSEGFGISRLVKENCDVLIKIPMIGHVNSLNASTATAIVVSEVFLKINDK